MILKLLIIFLSIFLVGCESTNSALMTQEKILISSGNKNKLIEFYKKNLLYDSSFKKKLIKQYLDIGDIQSAELYFSVYKKIPSDIDLLYQLSRMNYMKGEFDKSNEILEVFNSNGGDKKRFYLLKGKIFSGKKNYSSAIKYFNESRKHGVSDSDAKNNIAVVYIMKGEFKKATDILSRLYSMETTNDKIRTNLLVAAIRSGNYELATTVLTKKSGSKIKAKNQLNILKRSMINEQQDHLYLVNKNNRAINREVDVNKKLINGLDSDKKELEFYRIQILASYEEISTSRLTYLKRKFGHIYVYKHDGWNRYCIGRFKSLGKAEQFLDRLDIKGAFIVSYKDKGYKKL